MILMDARILRFALVTFVVLACASAQRPAQPGPWSRSKIPEGWVVHKTKSYQIQSLAGIEKAKRLGKHMEAMNLVYRRLFRPDKGGAKQDRKSVVEAKSVVLGGRRDIKKKNNSLANG